MIFLLTEFSDNTTTIISEWLTYFGEDWIRVNEQDTVSVQLYYDEVLLEINNSKIIKLSTIKSNLYRRGKLNLEKTKSHSHYVNIMLAEESHWLEDFVYFNFRKIRHISSFQTAMINKLVVLSLANRNGLTTPNTFVVNDFSQNIENDKTYITKPLTGNSSIPLDENLYGVMHTIKVKKEKGQVFAPSLIQEYIDKKYELRIFYLHGKFWTMAIFSQSDEQTVVDFRNYNKLKPNRNVPFNLPNRIKRKLIKLMNNLELNSGSIDMIVTKNMEFVFLEVNPIGQFGMVSEPCNYHLEKEIANYLRGNE